MLGSEQNVQNKLRRTFIDVQRYEQQLSEPDYIHLSAGLHSSSQSTQYRMTAGSKAWVNVALQGAELRDRRGLSVT